MSEGVLYYFCYRQNWKHCCLHKPFGCNHERAGSKFSAIGVSAEFVGKGQVDCTVQSRVLRGDVQLLFISCQCLLCNVVYHNMLLTDQYKKSLVGIAVDEAHCVKTW